MAAAVLALKLTLAPTLIAATTEASRRLGHRAGGLVGGLPIVAGLIVLIYRLGAISHSGDLLRHTD